MLRGTDLEKNLCAPFRFVGVRGDGERPSNGTLVGTAPEMVYTCRTSCNGQTAKHEALYSWRADPLTFSLERSLNPSKPSTGH